MDTPSKLYRWVAIAALSLSAAYTASADTLWTFAGDTTPTPITGSVTFNDSGSVTSYAFTDGSTTVSGTNPFQPISYQPWVFLLTDPVEGVEILTQLYGAPLPLTGEIGTWSDPPWMAVQEPSTVILTLLSIASLILGGAFFGSGYQQGVYERQSRRLKA